MAVASELGGQYLAMPIVGLVFKEAADLGCDFRPLLRRLELPYSPEALRAGQLPPMPRAHAVHLYRMCMRTLCDHATRTESRTIITFDETAMLCRCIINARDLDEVIRLARQFCSMLETRHIHLALTVENGMARFVMDTRRVRKTRATLLLDLFGLAFYHQVFSWLIGEDIVLAEVGVAYEETVSQELVAPLFDRAVHFGQSCNSLSFPAALLQRPVLRNYEDLLKLQHDFPFEILPAHLTCDSLANRLVAIFKRSLMKNSAFPSLSRTASLLNQSSATLRRRLVADGTTVNEIKQKCRQEVAADLLLHTRLSVGEISERLGFSAPSAFRRAFRSWTGISASEYRNLEGGPPRASTRTAQRKRLELHGGVVATSL